MTSLTLTCPTAPATARGHLGRRLAARLALPVLAASLLAALALCAAPAVALLLRVV